MTGSIVSSLFSTLDSRRIGEIASHLGESPQAVSSGLESSTASLIGGLANRAGDSTWMSQVFKLVSQAPSNVNIPDLVNSVTGSIRGSSATSSLLDSGRDFLSMIFGPNQSSVFDTVGRSTGLRSSVITTLMSMAAPLLMSTLGRVVRETHMNPSGLKDLLISEGEGIRGLLPSGFSESLQGLPALQPTPAADTRPIALGTVAERTSRNWLWLIPLLLIPALFYWGYLRRQQPATEVTRVLSLNIPQGAVESQLLAFIQDPAKGVDRNLWINYDRLLFDTGSTTLRPESGEQLRNIAAILTAYPNVHVKIGGYTDNTGNAQSNLKLSLDRANGVMAELVRLGVSPNRMEAQGYGEQYPVGDNSTAEGRAKNRRIAMNVTQK